MTIPTGDGLNVAAELARLRGEMSTGIEQIKGQLALIAQAQVTTTDDLKELRQAVDAIDGRVSALEERRWPIGPLTVLTAIVGAVAALGTWLAGQ